MDTPKTQILNSLALKIIAVITMTLDHIGTFLMLYFNNETISIVANAFRIIGRISFPIFASLLAEGMRYSKNRENYLMRLGTIAMIVLIANIIIYYAFNLYLTNGNIFITLLCSATFIYLFEKKDKNKYFLVIPAIVIILSFIKDIMGEQFSYPSYLKADYSLYGFLICIGLYFVYYLSDYKVMSLTEGKRDLNELRTFPFYRSITNLFWAGVLLIINVIFWLITYINVSMDVYNVAYQSYALLATIPLLLYNGKKGYNNKIVQYGFYLYYPLHLLIIFLGFYLAFGAPVIW